ncbi:MAG: 4Fe-4S single cluster domain-containing protein [Acidobacteria bacterium]|nr:4Fe-4S single cluster domain-containing protein [Acidobacteriota bacterium]
MSRANGPGVRAVVWFQGCTLGCPGCFNPGTHDAGLGYEGDVESLAGLILAAPGIEGVSISGGEPFQQPEALAELVGRLRETPLSILVFSGYPMEVARARPGGPEILANTDVLVAGPYRQDLHFGSGLLGSANQRLHLLTGRYRLADFVTLPASEVILHRDGSVTVTGFRRFGGIRGAAGTGWQTV